MIDNRVVYKDLRKIDQVELSRYIRKDLPMPLYLFDPVRKELSAEPILLWNFEVYDDNIYRIKEDDSLVDCVAYPIKVDSWGFYIVTASEHGFLNSIKYLEFLNHKDFMGVYYKGNSDITYAPSINSFINLVPSHLYLKYKHTTTNN